MRVTRVVLYVSVAVGAAGALALAQGPGPGAGGPAGGGRGPQGPVGPPPAIAPAAATLTSLGPAIVITEAECTAAKLGTSIPTSAIGLPVSAVTLTAPRWVAATEAQVARCEVDGVMAPVDRSATARPINFRVWLPAEWNRRAAQQGGGGNNGVIPNLAGAYPIMGVTASRLGFATYGSDSGHQSPMGPRGAAPAPDANDWALNDEAIKNLGHMQLKKTHDAAMVIIERAYGSRPRYNYYTGTSQGGREALTVAQRYPADYDGIIANVPIVNFSSLMLAPELIRIHEKPLVNWVPPVKVNAIRGEFVRQCDTLDGLVDGVINNYMACWARFDVTQGAAGRTPWVAKRCPNNVDPNPADTTPSACLTDGQISTLEVIYRRYRFATPLASGVRSFGMWLPNTDPSGSGLLLGQRFRGQEGAAPDAPMHSHLGVLGVTGFLMQDVNANPLDYVEGGPLNARRLALSADLDSTNPDLSAFAKRGGKAIITIGTGDTLASPGAQLDYYQSVIDRMGQSTVDGFARLFVIPQANHGLGGTSYGIDGDGKTVPTFPLPNTYDRFAYLLNWVEKNTAPGKTLAVSAGDRTWPLCSYPTFPRYVSGPVDAAASYRCDAR